MNSGLHKFSTQNNVMNERIESSSDERVRVKFKKQSITCSRSAVWHARVHCTRGDDDDLLITFFYSFEKIKRFYLLVWFFFNLF